MSAKKTTKDKKEDPLGNFRMNISITHGTRDVLRELAAFKHTDMSAVITCLIRTEAERIGLLSPTVKDTRKKEVELECLPAAARAKITKAK